MGLEALLKPRSIAVVGASEKPTIGRRLIASLDRIGFAGSIFPVNPNYPTVLGRRCYGSIAELPEAPDVAVFCVGHERVLDPLAAAAERGVKGAVIYDGGFAERGEDGRRLQSQIEGICRDAGIALCGPNCMGVLSPHHPSTTYLQELRDPTGLAGNVGIVSQSGGILHQPAERRQALWVQSRRLVRQRSRYWRRRIISNTSSMIRTPK